MKTLFSLFLMIGISFTAFAQSEELIENQISNMLDEANNYYGIALKTQDNKKYFFQLARDKYLEAKKLSETYQYETDEIIYQLCFCALLGAEDLREATKYYDEYKKLYPNNKNQQIKLENSIERYKKTHSQQPNIVVTIDWNKYRLQRHTGSTGFEYSHSWGNFQRNGKSYQAPARGFGLEKGWVKGITASIVDIGFYQIQPYGTEKNDFWNFDTWSYRIGWGVRLFSARPMFSLGSLCFRYTGYAGLAVEGLMEGGEFHGDEETGYFNAMGWKLTSGIFISSKNIPRGLRIEAIYQGHWHFSDNPYVKYEPRFGIQFGTYLGYGKDE
ncbi:MAG: hypothetical protein LBR81_08100 [Prevotellaceae bacterium]|jgi:hypothetical protein|nr:hypothetical protein [Prevotellaceae bacterium]